jgi:hypothetical protein
MKARENEKKAFEPTELDVFFLGLFAKEILGKDHELKRASDKKTDIKKAVTAITA